MELQLQVLSQASDIPSQEQFEQWVICTLQHLEQPNLESTEVCIRVVDEEEITTLNQQYRNKAGATNVLSFPQELPVDLALAIADSGLGTSLGDIVLCAPAVESEASAQGKANIAHWAHLTVHGTLHLLGYDHLENDEADKMENLEIAILNQLDFANPY